jgi:hypothetical protein
VCFSVAASFASHNIHQTEKQEEERSNWGRQTHEERASAFLFLRLLLHLPLIFFARTVLVGPEGGGGGKGYASFYKDDVFGAARWVTEGIGGGGAVGSLNDGRA